LGGDTETDSCCPALLAVAATDGSVATGAIGTIGEAGSDTRGVGAGAGVD
jgi:hypothetical protein